MEEGEKITNIFVNHMFIIVSFFFLQQQKDAAESSGHNPCSSRDSIPLWAELEVSTQRSDVPRLETQAARQKK